MAVGALRQDPNLGVLFRENLRPVLDRESKQSLAKVLGSLPDPSQRGALATLFVALFKGLRYCERISSAADTPATRTRALLIFSLMKAENDSFVSYVRRHLRPRFEAESREAEGLDRLASAFEAETKKAMDVELVGTAVMKDPDARPRRASRTPRACSGTSTSRASSASRRRSRRESTRGRSFPSTARGWTRAFACATSSATSSGRRRTS